MGNNRTNKEIERARLLERWNWILEDVESPENKINTAMMLENSYEKMIEQGQVSEGWLESAILNEGELNEAPMTTNAVGGNLIPKVMFPMIKRVMPKLMANELVSIQPLSGPSGVIYYMIYSYSDTKGNISAGNEFSAFPYQGEPGFATWYSSSKIGPFEVTVEGDGDDTVLDTEGKITNFLGTSGEFRVKKITAIKKDGSGVAYNTVVKQMGSGAPTFAGEENVYLDYASGDIYLKDAASSPWTAGDELVVFVSYDQENCKNIPEMEFSVGSTTVETDSRKLKIRWTKESEQDMKSFHKIDVESELVKAASMQMNYEIDREILAYIDDVTISQLTFGHDWSNDVSGVGGNNTTGNFLDRHRALAQKIYQASAKIANYNRQGPASWAVVSPQVGAILSMLPDFRGEIAGGTFNVFNAGQLGSGLKVYIDPNRSGSDVGDISLGYKSNTTAYGAGVVYAPYANWMSNTVTNPEDFNSVRGFFTRYALDKVPRGEYFYGKVILSNYAAN
jgi:hypothetical protein